MAKVKELQETIPNSFWLDQPSNLRNSEAHFLSTGRISCIFTWSFSLLDGKTAFRAVCNSRLSANNVTTQLSQGLRYGKTQVGMSTYLWLVAARGVLPVVLESI